MAVEEITARQNAVTQIKLHARQRMGELAPTEERELLRYSWEKALADPLSPVMQAVSVLTEGGVSREVLSRFIDAVIGLHIDVANPWSSSYQITDIIGHISHQLLGEDLSRFKEDVRKHEIRTIQSVTVAKSPPAGVFESVESLSKMRRNYEKLQSWQRQLISSDGYWEDTAVAVAQTSNRFVEITLRSLIKKIWLELEISQATPAFVYFREMKAYASDLDVYYRGPKVEEVNCRLTKDLFILGFKRDLFSTQLVNREISLDRVDYDIVYYFFNGKVVEFNGCSFDSFYKEHILANADLEKIWALSVHPYLSLQLCLWGGKSNKNALPLRLLDYKKLQYRTITNLMYGLAVKFTLPFGPDDQGFLEELQAVLKSSEYQILLRSMNLANQCRNLHHLVTRRRWETADERVDQIIAKKLASQDLKSYEIVIKKIGESLTSLQKKYLGNASTTSIEYLPLYTDQRSEDAWRCVARIYNMIINDASFSTKRLRAVLFRSLI